MRSIYCLYGLLPLIFSNVVPGVPAADPEAGAGELRGARRHLLKHHGHRRAHHNPHRQSGGHPGDGGGGAGNECTILFWGVAILK